MKRVCHVEWGNSFARRRRGGETRSPGGRGGGAEGRGTRLARNGGGRNVEGETEKRREGLRGSMRSERRLPRASLWPLVHWRRSHVWLHAGSRGERNAGSPQQVDGPRKCVHACACDVRRSRDTHSRVSRERLRRRLETVREVCFYENEKGIARGSREKESAWFSRSTWWDFSGALLTTVRGPPASILRKIVPALRITRTCAHKGARCVLLYS